ncbi:unnamed protein product, partial [Brassica oleracea]
MATSRLQMEGDDSKCETSVNAMALGLYDESGSKVAALSDDARPLVDLDPSSVTTGGWLEDTSLVETYNISEEDYAKRTGEFFYCLELVFHIPDSFRKLKEKRVSQNPAASEVKVGEYPERDPLRQTRERS